MILDFGNLTNDDFLTLVLQNAAPLVLGAIVSLVGWFGGFVLFEFLNKRRIALLVLSLLVSFYVVPYRAGWIVFGIFGLMVAHTVLRALVGPKQGNHIYFAGFYDNSGSKGYLSRNGTVRFLDAQFLQRFNQLIEKSKTHELTGLDTVNLKVPSLVFSWCDFERFRKLADRYSEKGVGVV
jgi:hypothetical protein